MKASLNGIRNNLTDTGLFLWFEMLADTHFDRFDEDAQGFSSEEMDRFADEAGLKKVEEYGLYKVFRLFGKTFSTYYRVPDGTWGIPLMELVEKCCPLGRPSNLVKIYEKA